MSAPPDSSGAAGLDRVLEKVRAEGRVGLMTHIVLGYPTLEASRHIAQAMIRSGVDLIEVQIPFSDPTADGPTITMACHRALARGLRVSTALEFVAELSPQKPGSILFMSYFNLLYNYRPAGGDPAGSGVAAFARAAAAAGAGGLIVPDLPPEEDQEGYPEACRASGIHPVYVVSPNSTRRRLQAVARVAGGFIYSTSRTGTTGKEMDFSMDGLKGFLKEVREVCRLPVAVGFSISRREQVEALRGHADIAVVGSHLIRLYEKSGLNGLERELRILAGRKD
jgi:tryptophan synthase alpha chain